MTPYEKILINIFANATFKIVGAIDLHQNNYSYNLSFFSAVIAEEELAKLVILPFAQELDELEEVIQSRDSAYFKHTIKQKLFTDFGLQNRTHEDIEKIKQDCLYVRVEKNLTPVLKIISKDQSLTEIKHAVLLFTRFSQIHYFNKLFTQEFRDGVFKLINMLKANVLEKLPEIDVHINEESEQLKQKTKEELNEYVIEHLLRNPYELISMFKAVFKEKYKERLAEIKYLNYAQFEAWLAKIYT